MEEIEIVDDNQDEILPSLVGLSIVTIHRDKNTNEDWSHGDNSVTMALSDGRVMTFVGCGFDASSLMTYITKE